MRHAWAKVYCDLLRHPKIVGRPDSDKVLWLGLILYAKEHGGESGLVTLDADSMKSVFGIKAPLQRVREGLAYMLSEGMLLRVGAGLMLKSFKERQEKAGDTPEAHAARQKNYVIRKKQMTSLMTSKVTSGDGERNDAEVEEEEETNSSAVGIKGGNPQDSQAVDNVRLADLPDEQSAMISKLMDSGDFAEANRLLAQWKPAPMGRSPGGPA